jgi:carboxymethylenebutenolidase
MSRWPRALRIALWVAIGLTALVLVVGAFLAISIAVDGRGSAGRLAQVTNTTIPGGTGPNVPAYVATPSGPGPHPTVIMIHEFWGLNPDIVSKADLLGYVVVASNVFRDSATGYLPRAIYQVVSTPVEEVNEDIDAVVAWVGSRDSLPATERTPALGPPARRQTTHPTDVQRP